MRKYFKKIVIPVILMAMLVIGTHAPTGSRERESSRKTRVPENVYIELTRDFYEAMKRGGDREQILYTTDPSLEYLREISVSSRFIVETNLQIIRQQEQIISLLEEIAEAGVK